MIKSNSNDKLNMYLRFIGEENMNSAEEFIKVVANRTFKEFKSEEELSTFFYKNLLDLYTNTSSNDIDTIRSYSGIAFRDINSILRGTWNYDYNGRLTDERKRECLAISEQISNVINKSSPLESDIKTYRGVSLSSFRDYGITKLEDLTKLVGEYYFDCGFTSTSLLRERSFFNRPLEYHEKCNIEIEYLIPKECEEGLPLITDDLSFSKVQTEFLLNSESLSKIVDVKIDPQNKTAHIVMVYVPQIIWNKRLREEKEESDIKRL